MFGLFRKKTAQPTMIDLASIDSREKAEQLYRRGELEKLFLVPKEFGGKDTPENTLFVPVGIAQVKRGIDLNIIRPLIKEGKTSKYAAFPEYTGTSFIPISIKIVASEPGNFTTVINIWGEALTRAKDSTTPSL